MVDDSKNLFNEIVADLLNFDDFAMIKGHPCKIIGKVKSLYGKYSKPIIKLARLEIFSNNKLEETIKPGKTVQILKSQQQHSKSYLSTTTVSSFSKTHKASSSKT